MKILVIIIAVAILGYPLLLMYVLYGLIPIRLFNDYGISRILLGSTFCFLIPLIIILFFYSIYDIAKGNIKFVDIFSIKNLKIKLGWFLNLTCVLIAIRIIRIILAGLFFDYSLPYAMGIIGFFFALLGKKDNKETEKIGDITLLKTTILILILWAFFIYISIPIDLLRSLNWDIFRNVS